MFKVDLDLESLDQESDLEKHGSLGEITSLSLVSSF
jgi:hypothetical protein